MVQIIYAIRTKPFDSASLFCLPVDERALGVLVFSQREYADEFQRQFADMPDGCVIAPVEAPDLVATLNQQKAVGVTHVVTDFVEGAGARYNDEKTLTIDEYINRIKLA